MGVAPMALRRFCNHSGLGLFFIPRIVRPRYCGHACCASGDRVSLRSILKEPGISGIIKGFKVPAPAAAKSLAIPRTPKQSGRLGVTLTSMTGSSKPAYGANSAPTGAFSANSMMPSWPSSSPNSFAEHNMPKLVTPRIFVSFNVRFNAGTCVPGRPNTDFNPRRAFGAPHTI